MLASAARAVEGLEAERLEAAGARRPHRGRAGARRWRRWAARWRPAERGRRSTCPSPSARSPASSGALIAVGRGCAPARSAAACWSSTRPPRCRWWRRWLAAACHEPVLDPASLPALGAAPAGARALVAGGWVGVPGGVRRRRSAKKVSARCGGRRGEPRPRSPPRQLGHERALELLNRRAPGTLALVDRYARALATGRIELVVVPFDSLSSVRVLLSASPGGRGAVAAGAARLRARAQRPRQGRGRPHRGVGRARRPRGARAPRPRGHRHGQPGGPAGSSRPSRPAARRDPRWRWSRAPRCSLPAGTPA